MKCFLAVLACLFAGAVSAQRYSFINYTVEDGIAQSQVRDVCQDQNGYLWIGTNSGLSRFNGMEFVNYSVDDGLPENSIRKLYISQDGNLWVATSQGVSKFVNYQIDKTYDFVEQYRINDIAEYHSKIYFASNTGLIQIEDDQFSAVGEGGAEDYHMRSIINYKDSVLICGSNNGLYGWDGKEFSIINIPEYPGLNVRSLKIVGEELYISAVNVGLIKYNMGTGELVNFNLDYTTVSYFDIDEDEIFGITSNQGAFLITENDTLYFNENNWSMTNGFKCIFKDKEDNIWIGTDGSGLMKFSGTSVVYFSTNDGLSSDIILSIQEDAKGNFVFGTYDEGVTQFQSDSVVSLEPVNEVLPDNTVWTILTDSLNHVWIGTSRGLTVYNENHRPVSYPELEAGQKIRTMINHQSEAILMGGDHGMAVMNADSVYYVHPDLNIQTLHAVGNKVYCATFVGLYEFDKATNYEVATEIILPETKINTITSDYHGNLWVGSETGLFVRLNNDRFVRFPLDDNNFRSKLVVSLISAKDSSIWVGTMNSGVYQIDFDAEKYGKYKILNFGKAEGVIDEEVNINAMHEDSDGNIWVGTATALVRINPSLTDELFEYKPPFMHITSLRLFMEEFNYKDYDVELDSVFQVPVFIELPYNKNHLTFDFIGINLKDPESVQYEYKLIGVDEHWAPISKSNYATYSFLQPGDYTFQVRAMNTDREWSIIDEMHVIIKPPFWKTWWFIALIVILLTLIIVYVFRSRIRVIKQQQNNEKLELKNRLLFLEQRSLNASMNRHFIFNSLNSIQYFINSSNKLSANKFLSNFAKLIRKNLDSSASNNFIVTLQEEIERIELYLSLEKMRFSDKFDYEIDVSSSIDTESVEIPSMILQPFVENSIIHGVLALDRKGEISVKVNKEFDDIVFELTDNGVGIDNSLKSKVQQIDGDHESKGVDITNRRIEILRKLTGENLLIVGPFQLNDAGGNCLGTKVVLKLGGVEKFEE